MAIFNYRTFDLQKKTKVNCEIFNGKNKEFDVCLEFGLVNSTIQILGKAEL